MKSDQPASTKHTQHTSSTQVHQPKMMNSRVINSSEILAGQNSLLIQHESEIYRLQVTRQGKLILTK